MIYPVRVWTRKGLRKLLRPDKQKSMSAIQVLAQHQNNYKLNKTDEINFKNISAKPLVNDDRTQA